jgi:hypothetical protein
MTFFTLLAKRISRKLNKLARKRRSKAEKKAFNRMKRRILSNAAHVISPHLTVKHGPFKGMKYPSAKAAGSALIPKLLGSYERELHSTIQTILKQNYTEIIDIGCAEGYYAIGLARHFPKTQVYVYDSNQEALDLCSQMAKINAVSNQLVFGSFCSPDQLEAIPYRGRSLIISDCEGYEKELFNERIVPKLAQHDLLIEIHDTIDISISGAIRSRFSDSHYIEVIESIDDIKKAKSYEYEELDGYDLSTRRLLVAEGRSNIMEWFFLRSKEAQRMPRKLERLT